MMTSTRLLCETRAHAVGRCNPLPLHGARTCPDRVEGLVLRRSLQMPHSMPLPVNRKHAVVHCHVAHSSNGHDPWVMPTLSSRCLRVYPLPVEPWPRSRKSTCLDKAWTICAGDGVALSHITTRYTHRAIVVSAPHSDPISVIVQRLRPNDTSNDAYTLHEQAYACKQVIPEDLAAYTGWCHRMFAPDFRKGVTQTDALQDYGVRFRAFGAAMKAKTASDAAARTPASTDGDAPNNSAEHEPSDARKIVNNIRQGTRTSAVLEKSGYHTMDEYCGSGLDIPGTVLCLTSTHSGLSLEAPTPSFWQLVCSLLHAAVAPQTGGRCRWCAASQYPWRCCRCRTSEGRPECGGNTLC
eukprot:m.442352 g.442352  ORF g.442352 m.442352 type:complete len:353 (+) comp21476_c0_seq1:1350-2408(+)